MAANDLSPPILCAHINAQSLEAHFADVSSLILSNNLSFLAISESWLKPSRASSFFHNLLPDYRLERADRSGKAGGGVALFVHSSIAAKPIDCSQHSSASDRRPEFLLVILSVAHSVKILCVIVYSPPKAGFWSDVEEAILNCNDAYDFTMLLGDLNVNWAADSTPRRILATSLHTCNLEPLGFSPTHHKGSSHTTIDYICVSDCSKVSSFYQEYHPAISEHEVLFATLSFNAPSRVPRAITCRSFRNFVAKDFVRDLSSADWGNLERCRNVDDKVSVFTETIRNLLDKHAPYHSFVAKKRPTPWMSSELVRLKRDRNLAWAKYKRTKHVADHSRFKALRNRVQKETRNAISTYYRNKFRDCGNAKETWQCVNDLGIRAKSTDPVTFPADANELNRHFIGNRIITDLHDSRPTAQVSPDNRFYFKHVELSDIAKAIKLSRSNARGPDDTPMNIIRMGSPDLLPILAHIFDSSLQSSVFPSAWKQASIRPIPKRHPPLDVTHFRPISILCAASKLLETIAYKQICNHVYAEGMLDTYQSGFRKSHGTQTAMARIVDDIRVAIDKEEVTLLVAIDYSVAFDLMNITLLVDKLKAMGFSASACEWVRSFLSERSQTVLLPSGECSTPLSRKSGVPQGSPLGPLFFSLFINDAPHVLRFCKHHLYADDFTIYCHGSFKDLAAIIRAVNDDLARVLQWAQTNGLQINTKKTAAMWLGSRGFMSRLREMDLPPLILDNNIVPYSETVKILGVTLDNSLSWAPHCGVVTNRCFATLSRLRKCSDMIPRDTKLLLVKALIFPVFDYCSVLFSNLSGELSLKLSRCRNAAVRFVMGLRKSEHITPSYISLQILPLAERRNYLMICFLVTILRYNEPSYLTSLLSFRDVDAAGSRRLSELELKVPRARTCCFQSSFQVHAAVLWNNLPSELRRNHLRPCFKSGLFKHYFESAFTNASNQLVCAAR